MTLTQVANQLFDLSVAGYFNSEKFTRSQFCEALKHWLLTGDSVIMEIALPDGHWHFEVVNYGDGYDYYIPETREQDARLREKLLRRNA